MDFLVNDAIWVELKALIRLEDVHLAQAVNYPEAFKLPAGLLGNLVAKSLNYKRLINNKQKVTNSEN